MIYECHLIWKWSWDRPPHRGPRPLLFTKQFTKQFKAIHGLAPKYLCDLLTFKSSLYNLRSAGSILLSMPAVRSKTIGDRAFMVAAPTLWNSLPKELCAITNVNSFKAHIKTYPFRTFYWWAILYSVLTCMHIHSFYCYYFFKMHRFLFVSCKVIQLYCAADHSMLSCAQEITSTLILVVLAYFPCFRSNFHRW